MGSKAIEGAKAISVAFVLLDFQQKSVVYETECSHVAGSEPFIISERHTSDFVLNTF